MVGSALSEVMVGKMVIDITVISDRIKSSKTTDSQHRVTLFVYDKIVYVNTCITNMR